MRYNRVGKTDIRLSAVGFGTCQLRLVPERQAVETLRQGFRMGVNWVHTAPDYDGAENLVARTVREAGGDVMMVSQGYGDMAHFEYLFENTCRILDRQRLAMFGIACIDDREYLGEDVWGPSGMVEFLLEKKREGRLSSIFCSTHGTPDYISRLITCGCFDALMITHNLLGFHLLSYFPKDKAIEDLTGNREIIFPLALRHRVSLLVMKPLAGGLVARSKAFPPHARFSRESHPVAASEQLKAILRNPAVCSVVPGTASPDEARENAGAGREFEKNEPVSQSTLEDRVAEIRGALCRRCGRCEASCSHNLPISWLFRDAYICNYPSETFETIDALQYFHLHPREMPVCESCKDVTCECPHGIPIREALISIHFKMMELKRKGLIPATPKEIEEKRRKGDSGVQVLNRDIPSHLRSGEKRVCRIYLENTGSTIWPSPSLHPDERHLGLGVFREGRFWNWIALRQDVPPKERTYFSFLLEAPWRKGDHRFQFYLTHRPKETMPLDSRLLFSTVMTVTGIEFLPAFRDMTMQFRAAAARRLGRFMK